MNILYVDIETQITMDPKIIEMLKAEVKPKANLKDPKKIEQDIAEKMESVIQKTALNPNFGTISMIGYAVDDEDPVTITTENLTEREMIESFTNEIPWYETSWAGWNVAFDISFLRRRSIIHSLPIRMIPDSRTTWNTDKIIDVMSLWTAPMTGQDARCSLKHAALALGLNAKDDIDGSMVPELLRKGEWKRVEEYCKRDVEITRLIHKRIQGIFTLDEEELPF